jgi:hypothetical protein
MFIQSFVMNISGCLDNLAWIWVFESDLRTKDGKQPEPYQVGLGESYGLIRKSFSRPFRKYLRTRRKWFDHIAEFRHPLAHRIPLYIPPYIISEHDSKKYAELEQASADALVAGDYEKYDQLQLEQKALGTYRPWISHSLTEKSPVAVFHWQLLQDYVTIDEMAREMLAELARFDEKAKRRAKPNRSIFQKTYDSLANCLNKCFH